MKVGLLFLVLAYVAITLSSCADTKCAPQKLHYSGYGSDHK